MADTETPDPRSPRPTASGLWQLELHSSLTDVEARLDELEAGGREARVAVAGDALFVVRWR